MVLIGPKPVFIGEYKIPIGGPSRPIWKKIPIGGTFRLKYFLAYYPITISQEGGDSIQIEPDLKFTLKDSDGRQNGVRPIWIKQVTAPASLPAFGATQPLNLDYEPGADVGIFIDGYDPVFPIPWISVTLFGIQGFGTFGGGF